MEIFAGDDKGYLSWPANNPNGYVLNTCPTSWSVLRSTSPRDVLNDLGRHDSRETLDRWLHEGLQSQPGQCRCLSS